MHRGWPEFSRLESNTPGLGPQAGGQVYISPDKFCEAKDKGAGGGEAQTAAPPIDLEAGAEVEDWGLPKM